MNKIKKIIAYAAATALAATSLSGCTIGKNSSYALTVDGQKVPAGVFIYYLANAYGQATQTLQQEDTSLDVSDAKAVAAKKIDGKDTDTWVYDKATELCQNYVAVDKKFKEYKLKLTDEQKSEIDSYADQFAGQYDDSMKKAGVSEDSIKDILRSGYESEQLFDYFYADGGTEGKTNQEYYDYYKNNNARVVLLTFEKKDGSGNLLKGKKKTAFEKKVQGYYDDIKKAGDEDEMETEMEEVSSEYEEYSSEQASKAEAATATDASGSSAEATTEAAANNSEVTEDPSEDTSEAESKAKTKTKNKSKTDDETSEEETTEDTTEAETESGSSSEEEGATTTTTAPFANETIVSKWTTTTDEEGNTEAAKDITYNPSKSVQMALFDKDDDNYIKDGELKLINDDETEYIILRRDITERMTDSDLWTKENIESVSQMIYNDEFQKKVDAWIEKMKTVKNKTAYRKFKASEIDLYGQNSSSNNANNANAANANAAAAQ